jgi:hypothetical protein
MLEFLKSVADPPDQQVATEPWWLAAVKPAPLAAEFIEAGTHQDRQLCWLRDRSLRVRTALIVAL